MQRTVSVVRLLRCVVCLACLILAVPDRTIDGAEQRWPDEKVADNFYIHADFSLQHCPNLLPQLAEMRKEIEQSLALKNTREPIHLFLFSEKQTYQEYLRIHFPQAPDRRALFIKARGPGMVFAHCGTDFEIDVRHECTHAILHTSLPHLPLWLDEGLAEYFEVPPGQRGEPNAHATVVKGLAELGELPRLEALEELTDINSMGRREYREAWAWTHFCLEGPAAAREELRLYLQDLTDNNATENFSRRLPRRVGQYNRLALDHFARLR